MSPKAGTAAFHYRHQIRWGECDPAGIVYAPNIFGYALQAVEAWFEEVIGESWTNVIAQRGLATPWVHTDIDFFKPMRPGDRITVGLDLANLGNTSLGFTAVGTGRDGEPLFRARLVSCFMNQSSGRAVRIPEDLRSRMRHWLAAHGAGAVADGLEEDA